MTNNWKRVFFLYLDSFQISRFLTIFFHTFQLLFRNLRAFFFHSNLLLLESCFNKLMGFFHSFNSFIIRICFSKRYTEHICLHLETEIFLSIDRNLTSSSSGMFLLSFQLSFRYDTCPFMLTSYNEARIGRKGV